MFKFSSYRTKEDMLKRAWQRKGFAFQRKRVHLDHDYAPELLRKRREYKEAKAALKEKNIRFQTPFPARLFYKDGTVIYNSAEVATADMADRGIPMTVLKTPTSLLDRVSQLTWLYAEDAVTVVTASIQAPHKASKTGFMLSAPGLQISNPLLSRCQKCL